MCAGSLPVSKILTPCCWEAHIARMNLIVVKAAFDAQARVWYVESSDVSGLNVEAPSVEALRDKLPGAILDLLDCDDDGADHDVPVELIAHASTRVVRRIEPA